MSSKARQVADENEELKRQLSAFGGRKRRNQVDAPNRRYFVKPKGESLGNEYDHGGVDDGGGGMDCDPEEDVLDKPATVDAGTKRTRKKIEKGQRKVDEIPFIYTALDFAQTHDDDFMWRLNEEEEESNESDQSDDDKEFQEDPVVLRRSTRAAVASKPAQPVAIRRRRDRVDKFTPTKSLDDAIDDTHRNLMNKCIALEEEIYKMQRINEEREASEVGGLADDVRETVFFALVEHELVEANANEFQYLVDYYSVSTGHSSRRHPLPACKRTAGYVGGSDDSCSCISCRLNSGADLSAVDNSVLVSAGNYVVRARGTHGEDQRPMAEEVKNWIDAAVTETSLDSPDDEKFTILLNPQDPSKSTTISEFVKIVNDIGSVHDIPKSGLVSIWKALHHHTSLATPFRVNPKTGNLIPTMHEYEKEDLRDNTTDACVNQCMTFAGEFRTDIFCSFCYMPRFTKCNFGGQCKFGEECSPFINSTHTYRAAHLRVIYRSLIIKLIQMCKQDVLSGGTLFNYNDFRHKEPGYLCDILDGEAVREHMVDMHEKFVVEESALVNPDGLRVVEASLVLSCFYDGDKLYKRSNDSLWPLLAEVLNCNPSYRTKLGLGLFLVAMHNVSVGSGAEQSMIDNLFSEEIRQGENVTQFECVDEKGDKVIVLLQFRGVLFNADTKAYEKIFHVQGVGSLQGCSLCGSCHGLSRDILKARVYCSGCLHLPDDHILRHIGEEVDMPDGYYGEEADRNRELGKEISDGARQIVIKEKPDKDDNVSKQSLTHPRVDGKRGKRPVRTSWVSRTSEFEDFAGALWVPYNDNRPSQPYRRVTHDEYLQNSKDAALAEMRVFIDKKGKLPKNKVYAVNGVHKKLSAFSVLKSFQLSDQVPDAMHAVANVVNYWFNVLTGERGLETASRQLSVYQRRMPYLQFENIIPPFTVTKKLQLIADSVFSCINVPSKYKRDYALDLPFKHASFLNSHQKMVLVISYIEYLLSFTDLSLPYKRYFARWAGDLRSIMSPRVKLADLPYLEMHVIETKALSEFMFPDSESPFISHQIVDIVHGIKRLGPVSNWMCFTGERTMKKLGDSVPDGGANYLLPVSTRFVAKENASDYNNSAFTENCAQYTDNAGLYTTMVLKMQKKFVPVALSPYMKDSLFQSIQEFLNTQEISHLVVKSPFARLYYTFEELFGRWRRSADANRPSTFPLTMADWVQQLYAIRVGGAVFTAQKVSHLVNGVVHPAVNGAASSVNVLHLRGNETEEELGDLSEVVMRDFVGIGVLLDSDFDGIIRDLANFAVDNKQPIAAFKHAIVKGVQLTGRGASCAEPSVAMADMSGTNAVGLRTTYLIQNKFNKLTENWSPTYQLNSWCKVEDYHVPRRGARREVESRVYFGQLNYFFRLYFPTDRILHGAAFASVVLRKAVMNKDTRHYMVSAVDTESYYADKQFVAVNYIDSTAIAVNAFDGNNLPMLNPKKQLKAVQNAVSDYILKISMNSSICVTRLDMIELHKERLHMNYDSIEFDKENAKLFEAEVLEHHKENDVKC